MSNNELTVVEQLINSNKERILSRFPKLNEWLTPEIWFGIMMDAAKRPELQRCAKENPDSLIGALCKLAEWGLKPDNDEAFINVYNEKHVKDGKDVYLPTAQAQWMWKGGIRRGVECGAVAHAVPDLIREGDKVRTYVDRHGRHLEIEENHKPNSKIIGSYCLFWLPNGLVDYERCDLEDIENAKKASLRNQRRDDPKLSPAWQYGYGEMAKKTAVRRGLKRMQGKRDSSYASMMATTTQFDAETTGENLGELSPDETPRGRVVEERPPLSASALDPDYRDVNPDEGRQDAGQEEGPALESGTQTSAPDGEYPTAEEVRQAFVNSPLPPAQKFARIELAVPDFKAKGYAKLDGPERKKVMEALR